MRILCFIFFLMSSLISQTQGAERAFPPTGVGKFEIKSLPPGRLIEARVDSGNYFEHNNRLFRELFRYIRQNKIAMTVPVEADIEPGKMYFWVGSAEADKATEGQNGVEVIDIPPRLVASYGVRGGYSRENFTRAVAALQEWLEQYPAWEIAGPSRAVFWDGPFKPGFLKRFEVHIPVAVREVSFNELLWKKRVILYRAADDALPAIAEAIEMHRDRIREREVVFLRDGEFPGLPFHLKPLALGEWSDRLGTVDGTSTFLLIGKDGLEKSRQTGALNLSDWFALIDTMPMRRQEVGGEGSR